MGSLPQGGHNGRAGCGVGWGRGEVTPALEHNLIPSFPRGVANFLTWPRLHSLLYKRRQHIGCLRAGYGQTQRAKFLAATSTP